MKISRLIQNQKVLGNFRAGLLLLCGFFLLGLLFGRVAGGAVTEEDSQQLHTYILHYARMLQESTDVTASLLSVLLTYLRYPVLVFLLGFTVVGAFLIPAACFTQAFFLSFSVHCFTSALGRSGVTLALSAFGIRCLFTVPCTLFLAVSSTAAAVQLLHRRRAKGKLDSTVFEPVYFIRFFACLLVLLIGAIAEIFWVPKLVGAVLFDLI